jgi:hypothetical protein
MKNYLLLLGSICSLCLNAQIYSEDFESYTVNDFLAEESSDWDTWSNTPGSTEDVKITDSDAQSGNNSIYFNATSSDGGPQDMILDFGDEYNTGVFNFSTYIKIESGKGAYFNFQSNTTVGEIWALDFDFTETGSLKLKNTNGELFSGQYPLNDWFKVSISADLTTNSWELLIDDISQGTFSNTINQVASLNIYPVNNTGNNVSAFYMDDISYEFIAHSPLTEDLAVTNIYNLANLAGIQSSPKVEVRNVGVNSTSSFDVTIDYNGNQISKSITGVNLNTYDTYEVIFDDEILLVAGLNEMEANILNVNGTLLDDDILNDTLIVTIDPIVPATGKVVIGEEGTGTWCGWCPRGTVAIKNMTESYGDFFIPLAIHSGDTLAFQSYADDMNFSGFPNSYTDRVIELDPSNFESQFLERIIVEPSAILKNGMVIENDTLKVSVSAEFVQNINGDFRLACVISEDNVMGSSSGFNQSNYYAGGANGIMGGYESLPNSVPASQMVYDHVARVILPNQAGQQNSFPTNQVNAGEVHTVNFYFPIQPEWDLDNIDIVSMLIDDNGLIDNGGIASKTEAESNGFVVATNDVIVLGVNNNITTNYNIEVYPNPSTDLTYLSINNTKNSVVSIEIFDAMGKLVLIDNYGELNGAYHLPINTSTFNSGIYFINITIDNFKSTKKLVME